MVTRLKPQRVKSSNSPQVGQNLGYEDSNNFKWQNTGSGVGDMKYSDFEWKTLSGNAITIEDISNNITPSSNFTVSAGTVKPGIEYVLRVNTGNTPYTMTLGTGVTNPNLYKTELKPNTVNQFKFIATSTNQLELEGVDSAVVSEINWGEIGGTLSNQTDLKNALNTKADNADVNTKTFFLTGTTGATNIATAQDAIDWYLAGKNPLIIYNNKCYTMVNYYRNEQEASPYIFATSAEGETTSVLQLIVLDGTSTVTDIYESTTINYSSATRTFLMGAGTGLQTQRVAQKVLDWYLLNNAENYNNKFNPIIISTDSLGSGQYTYHLTGVDTGVLIFTSLILTDGAPQDYYVERITINYANDTVTSLQRNEYWLGQYRAGSGITIDSTNHTISNTLPGAIVSAVAPSSPTEGMLWYDTTNDVLKVYDGTAWQSVGTGGGGNDIVYATQAEYNALLPGAESDNKHYFIYTESGGPTPSVISCDFTQRDRGFAIDLYNGSGAQGRDSNGWYKISDAGWGNIMTLSIPSSITNQGTPKQIKLYGKNMNLGSGLGISEGLDTKTVRVYSSQISTSNTRGTPASINVSPLNEDVFVIDFENEVCYLESATSTTATIYSSTILQLWTNGTLLIEMISPNNNTYIYLTKAEFYF